MDASSETSSAPGSGLAGQAAIVTGGARGIGAAVVDALVADGAHVFVADVRDELGRELVARLGSGAEFLHLDVTQESQWDAAIAEVQRSFDGLDVVVNNAGIIDFGPLEATTLASFRQVLDVNLVGTFLGMRAAIPAMRRRGGGAIVNLSSNAGLIGIAGAGGYVASKWAVRGLTKTAALELGADGIRVNSVHPGPTQTPLTANDDVGSFTRGQPIARAADPTEIAALVHFLCTRASSYCTGGEFVVDGGSVAGKVPG